MNPTLNLLIGTTAILAIMTIWALLEDTKTGITISDFIDNKLFNYQYHDKIIQKISRQICAKNLFKSFSLFKLGISKVFQNRQSKHHIQ